MLSQYHSFKSYLLLIQNQSSVSVFYPFAVHDLMGLFGTNGMKLRAHFVPYACIYFVKCHAKKLLVTFVVLGKKWHMKIKTILMKLMLPKAVLL